jgi:hypothetical protein
MHLRRIVRYLTFTNQQELLPRTRLPDSSRIPASYNVGPFNVQDHRAFHSLVGCLRLDLQDATVASVRSDTIDARAK